MKERLLMTAGLVPPGSVAADIGSDHAYLPVHLVRQGICPRAIASDIGQGPLQNAAKTVARAGLQDKIELRLSDGFSRFAPADANCWIMAGMGGTLMARLLDRALWLCQSGTALVLQPMRHAWEARQWLAEHHFQITEERACYEQGRAYHAIKAVYNAEIRIENAEISYNYVGELIKNSHPAAREILARERALLETRAKALQDCDKDENELRRLHKILEAWRV